MTENGSKVEKRKKWPWWLTWSVISSVALGILYIPDKWDQLLRWWGWLEMDMTVVRSVAFVVILLAISLIFTWPVHRLLTIPARRGDRLRGIAGDLRVLQQEIEGAVEREEVQRAGEVYRIKTILDGLRIRTPPLLSPRSRIPIHQCHEWNDFLIRMVPLAEEGRLKDARKVWSDCQFEWEMTQQAIIDVFAKEVEYDQETQLEAWEAVKEELLRRRNRSTDSGEGGE